jgi:GT2 family glycosyltransferase
LDNPRVSVVILNYNGAEVLERSVSSVLRSQYPKLEVIIVDNGSLDDSAIRVSSKYPVKVVRSPRNLGYCAGNNLGMSICNGEYFLLLNNDAFVDQNCISKLVQSAIRNGPGMFQPKLLYSERTDRINSSGNLISITGIGFCRDAGQLDWNGSSSDEQVSYASGACLLVSRKIVERIGQLDPVLFAYHDDLDWGWRALICGAKSMYVPSATAYHVDGHTWKRTSKYSQYLMERNRLFVLFKNYSGRSLLLLSPVLITTEIGVLLMALCRKWLPDKIRAYVWLLTVRKYLKEQRKLVQRRRKVPDKDVCSHFVANVRHPDLGGLIIPVNVLCNAYWRIVRRFL